jgi:hypothetical protein
VIPEKIDFGIMALVARGRVADGGSEITLAYRAGVRDLALTAAGDIDPIDVALVAEGKVEEGQVDPQEMADIWSEYQRTSDVWLIAGDSTQESHRACSYRLPRLGQPDLLHQRPRSNALPPHSRHSRSISLSSGLRENAPGLIHP